MSSSLYASEQPVTVLGTLLPQITANLSFGRGQIFVEQLQALIDQDRSSDLLIVTLQDRNSNAVLALLVALFQRSTSESQQSTAATILFGDWLQYQPTLDLKQSAALIGEIANKALSKRGVKFVQWPQDPPAQSAQAAATNPVAAQQADSWAMELGMQLLATLHYMRRDCVNSSTHDASEIQLDPIDDSFAQLVETTYEQTLDCPALSHMQTAAEILCGYRGCSSYRKELWFQATYRQQRVGCLILGWHPHAVSELDAAPPITTTGTLELVYMGIVAEYRGRGFGRQLIARTEGFAQRLGAGAVILAVDAANDPARRAYVAAGFRVVLRENVWGKSLFPTDIQAFPES